MIRLNVIMSSLTGRVAFNPHAVVVLANALLDLRYLQLTTGNDLMDNYGHNGYSSFAPPLV